MKKKILNITISIILLILLIIIIDFYTIYKTNKPLIILKENTTTDKIYYGIFYNTFKCTKTNEINIKLKTSKFKCPVVKINNKSISSSYQIIIPDNNSSTIFIKGIINNKYEIIYYGTEQIDIKDSSTTTDLSTALIKNQITVDNILKDTTVTEVNNGKLYISNNQTYQILKCNNSKIYIGNNNLAKEKELCQ